MSLGGDRAARARPPRSSRRSGRIGRGTTKHSQAMCHDCGRHFRISRVTFLGRTLMDGPILCTDCDPSH